MAATATTTARLGSSVLVAPWYPPVQLARQLTSIDVVSGGRLLPGFGIGWSPEEYQAAGAPFRRRGAQLDETLDVLDALWTTNPVRHEGERWSVPESWVDLKPVQRPRPPIYSGRVHTAGFEADRGAGRRLDGGGAGARPKAPRRGAEVAALGHRRCGPRRGRDPEADPHLRSRQRRHGQRVEQVADTLRALTDNGYPDAFVDLMFVVSGTDAHLEWVERLLAR